MIEEIDPAMDLRQKSNSLIRRLPVEKSTDPIIFNGEFDPGSGRTLAACLTHASRTSVFLRGYDEWRTGE